MSGKQLVVSDNRCNSGKKFVSYNFELEFDVRPSVPYRLSICFTSNVVFIFIDLIHKQVTIVD